MLTLTAGLTTCRPRFFTPRDERYPTLGPEVGKIAEALGWTLMPWQQGFVDVAYEYDPDTGLFRYAEADAAVPRQSGKTTITLAKKVHRLTKMAQRLGPQRSTYTAQTRQKARNKLERDFANALRLARPFPEITNPKGRPHRATEWRLSLNNGSEHIQFGRGNYLQIDAPSRTGGHGDTLDDGTIDEAFAHEDDTIEAGMSPSMITRRNAQLWVISTAGDARSKYWYRKVLAGRAAHESGQHGRICYVEFSAPEDADPADPATWWDCMPALGFTVTEDVIQAEWEKAVRKGQEGIDTFCRAYLNMWPEVPVLDDLANSGHFDVSEWMTMADPRAGRGARPVFGVDVGEDRIAHVAVAWRRADGAVQVMLADTGLSPSETPARLTQLSADWKGPVMLGGPAAGLEVDVPGSRVVTGVEFADSFGRFEDLFREGRLRHGNQPELNVAVDAARVRSVGSAGARALQLKDAPKVGPLAAVLRALHGLLAQQVKTPPTPMRAGGAHQPRASDVSTMSF